jgi:hypothetical protein
MKNKFTPVSIVKRPSWMTPDFNPEIANKKLKETFTPYAVIPMLLDYLRK